MPSRFPLLSFPGRSPYTSIPHIHWSPICTSPSHIQVPLGTLLPFIPCLIQDSDHHPTSQMLPLTTRPISDLCSQGPSKSPQGSAIVSYTYLGSNPGLATYLRHDFTSLSLSFPTCRTKFLPHRVIMRIKWNYHCRDIRVGTRATYQLGETGQVISPLCASVSTSAKWVS